MRKTIAKIAGTMAILGGVLLVLSNFFPEEGYILYWIGIVTIVICGIAYIATGEKSERMVLGDVEFALKAI